MAAVCVADYLKKYNEGIGNPLIEHRDTYIDVNKILPRLPQIESGNTT